MTRREGCTCPRSGAWYCDWCAAMAARAGLTLTQALALPSAGFDRDAPEGELENKLRLYVMKTLKRLYYHTHNSKRSDPGFLDCTIATPVDLLQPDEPSTLYIIELKADEGIVSPTQRRWLEALERVTRVETGVYAPKDWDKIISMLQIR